MTAYARMSPTLCQYLALGADYLSVKTFDSIFLVGKCGNGPNMRLEPDGLDVSHMGTPAKVAQLLRDVCNMDVSPALLKVIMGLLCPIRLLASYAAHR